MEPVEITVRFDKQGKAYPLAVCLEWADIRGHFDRPALAGPDRAAHISDGRGSQDL